MERGKLTGVFDECGVLVEDCLLFVSNLVRSTEEKEKEGGRELATFLMVSARHDFVGLWVGWFKCEVRMRLGIEPWRAVLAMRLSLRSYNVYR